MYKEKSILAITPARGGSKGVKRKNIRLLADKPLLAYTLEQVQAVNEIDEFYVSTEDKEIQQYVQSSSVPLIDRPLELASDEASTESVLLHALEVLENKGKKFDYIVVLEPTSPLRKPNTISAAIRKIIDSAEESLMTVIETRENIGELVQSYFKPLNPGAPRRRQMRAPHYIESGTLYVSSIEYLKKTGTLVCPEWLALEVDEYESIDINTELDFKLAEFLINEKKNYE